MKKSNTKNHQKSSNEILTVNIEKEERIIHLKLKNQHQIGHSQKTKIDLAIEHLENLK